MKILIAEDEPLTRKMLETSLGSLGHELTVTPDGLAAWTEFQRSGYDMVITDWMMPGLDGVSLCRKIRADRRERYTYVIILTVKGGKTNFLEAMSAEADDFLTKPYDLDELVARLTVAERILGLRQHVNHLEGLLPICSYCKKIRDQNQHWEHIENYIRSHSPTEFTHGVCPECLDNIVRPQLERL